MPEKSVTDLFPNSFFDKSLQNGLESDGRLPLSEDANHQSYLEQLKELPLPKVYEQLIKEVQALGKFGVTYSVSSMLFAASRLGEFYEERRFSDTQRGRGNRVATPINCLMVLMSAQPELAYLHLEQFKELGIVLSRIAQTCEFLVEEKGRLVEPRVFLTPPNQIKEVNITRELIDISSLLG